LGVATTQRNTTHCSRNTPFSLQIPSRQQTDVILYQISQPSRPPDMSGIENVRCCSNLWFRNKIWSKLNAKLSVSKGSRSSSEHLIVTRVEKFSSRYSTQKLQNVLLPTTTSSNKSVSSVQTDTHINLQSASAWSVEILSIQVIKNDSIHVDRIIDLNNEQSTNTLPGSKNLKTGVIKCCE